jgi:hypothetical protein
VQEAVPQSVSADAWVHLPAPSQAPVLPQALPALGAQPPCEVPGARLVHMPSLPATLHAWQRPQLDEPQQTPFTQVSPVKQLAVVVHRSPRAALSPHSPVARSQIVPGMHCALLVHSPRQASGPQMKGEQLRGS